MSVLRTVCFLFLAAISALSLGCGPEEKKEAPVMEAAEVAEEVTFHDYVDRSRFCGGVTFIQRSDFSAEGDLLREEKIQRQDNRRPIVRTVTDANGNAREFRCETVFGDHSCLEVLGDRAVGIWSHHCYSIAAAPSVQIECYQKDGQAECFGPWAEDGWAELTVDLDTGEVLEIREGWYDDGVISWDDGGVTHLTFPVPGQIR